MTWKIKSQNRPPKGLQCGCTTSSDVAPPDTGQIADVVSSNAGHVVTKPCNVKMFSHEGKLCEQCVEITWPSRDTQAVDFS